MFRELFFSYQKLPYCLHWNCHLVYTKVAMIYFIYFFLIDLKLPLYFNTFWLIVDDRKRCGDAQWTPSRYLERGEVCATWRSPRLWMRREDPPTHLNAWRWGEATWIGGWRVCRRCVATLVATLFCAHGNFYSYDMTISIHRTWQLLFIGHGNFYS